MGIGTGVDNLSLDRESRPTKTGTVDEMLAEVETLFEHEGGGDGHEGEVRWLSTRLANTSIPFALDDDRMHYVVLEAMDYQDLLDAC